MKNQLSKRISWLRDRVLSEQSTVERGERTFSWSRTAAAMEHYCNHAETIIYSGELIVGMQGKAEGMNTFQDPIPESEIQPRPEKLEAFIKQGFFILCGNHQVANYEKVLSVGLRGIVEQIECKLTTATEDSKVFLEAMRTFALAMIQYCRRYAATARKEMSCCNDDLRRKELAVIANNCERVIEYPPENFWQACQSLYFTFLLIPDSPGRIDQYLYSYYRQDIDSGCLTEEFAKELLSCLWIKYFEYWGKDHLRSGITHLALGGLTPDGECSVNDLSYLCLEVAEKLEIIRPQIAVRWNQKTPQRFMQRGVELLKKNFGSPDFCNDEQIVPALIKIGISPEDARNFCPSGCHEIMIPGKSQMGSLMGEFNLPKTLNCVLGVDEMPSGDKIALDELRDWESFYAAWRRVMKDVASKIHELSYFEDSKRAQTSWGFAGSLLTEGCIERGRGLAQGGAIYNYCNWDAIGIATLADSFMVIKKLVFESKTITLEKLAECLRNNWDGYELLRQQIDFALPRFGNDIREVDAIAAGLIRDVAEALDQYTPYRGGRYTLGTLAGYENAHAVFGQNTGATSDGRLAGEAFPGSLGPAAGRDRDGLTAMLNSVASIPHILLPTSTVVNVTIDPGLLHSEAGMYKTAAAIIAHFGSGGQQLQFTIADRNILSEAQKNPDGYRGLMVRVAGYSARFTSLEKNVQDEIINRTINHL